MSEKEPAAAKAPKDERDEVAKLQRQLDRAQFDAGQKEAFGKYDVTVPNEGELNYQDYLDQRPAEGVVRNGDLLQDAQTGKFASEEAYEGQKVDTQDYYDQKGNLVNKGEYQPPNYEAMGVLQLAKEAAKARQLGDRAEEETVREAVEHYLTMDAMKDSTESPEEAQARYETELARYDSLVDRFLLRPDGKPSNEAHAEATGEGDTSKRVPGSEAPVPENKAERTAETEVLLNGEKVTVGNVFTSPDGRKVAEVIAADGTKSLVFESDLTFSTPAEAPKADATEAEPAEKTEATTSEATTKEAEGNLEPGAYYNGKKVSVARVLDGATGDKTTDRLEVVDSDGTVHSILASEINYVKATVDEAAPKDAVAELEEIIAEQTKEPGTEVELYTGDQEQASKKWWQKAADRLRPLAGGAAWASAWADAYVAAPIRNKYGKWLNHDIEDSMSDEEKEKKRKNNRYIAIAAGAGVALIGAAIGGVMLANGLSSGSGHEAASGIGLGEHKGEWSPGAFDAGNGTGTGTGVESLPLDTGTGTGVETIPEAVTPTEAINVTSGEGGIELFDSLGLSQDTWNDNAQTLLNQFPQDFYLEGSDVRLMDSGPLSQGAQDFINSLR